MLNLQNNIINVNTKQEISRRKFLALGIVTAASALIPDTPLAAIEKIVTPERSLFFHNVYTGEELNTVYWKNGQYIPEALDEINFILRDIRTGKVKPINKKLLDILFAVRKQLKCNEPFSMISGYRTPTSNAMLRKKKKGVEKNSFHMYGKAIDISLPGYSLRGLRRAAMDIHGGGVGYYPRSKFVHIDVGEIRYWSG